MGADGEEVGAALGAIFEGFCVDEVILIDCGDIVGSVWGFRPGGLDRISHQAAHWR